MLQTDTSSYRTTPVTRRAIVVTGTRLAYATPLVAASIRLTELSARAEDAVSGLGVAARGMFPPTIESVSFTAPSWVLITGRSLTGAAVTFVTDGGTIPGGITQVSTDTQIIVSISDGLTILSTTVETPDGVDIFDQVVPAGPPPEEALTEAQLPVEEAPVEQAPVDEEPVEEQEPSVEEDAPVENDAPDEEQAAEEQPAEEAPVEEEASVEQVAAVEGEEEAPVEEEAPIEEQPVEEAAPVEEQPPVEQAPVEQPPVEEAPVEQAVFAVGVAVVVRHPETKMYDAPSMDGQVVMELQDESQLVIVGPKEETATGVWWPVQDPDSGLVGYIAETSLKLQQ